jgi:hypothetical protein
VSREVSSWICESFTRRRVGGIPTSSSRTIDEPAIACVCCLTELHKRSTGGHGRPRVGTTVVTQSPERLLRSPRCELSAMRSDAVACEVSRVVRVALGLVRSRGLLYFAAVHRSPYVVWVRRPPDNGRVRHAYPMSVPIGTAVDLTGLSIGHRTGTPGRWRWMAGRRAAERHSGRLMVPGLSAASRLSRRVSF